MWSEAVIRAASPDDCAAIADLYQHYVTTSSATFDYEGLTAEEWRDKLAGISARGYPFLVCEIAGQVVGYAYLNVFRGRAGWRFAAEDSIYLSPAHAGRGLGSRLLDALIVAVNRDTVRSIIAVISEEVDGSIALHRKAGFVEVGRMPAVGVKFERSIGCVLMQLSLQD